MRSHKYIFFSPLQIKCAPPREREREREGESAANQIIRARVWTEHSSRAVGLLYIALPPGPTIIIAINIIIL